MAAEWKPNTTNKPTICSCLQCLARLKTNTEFDSFQQSKNLSRTDNNLSAQAKPMECTNINLITKVKLHYNQSKSAITNELC